MEEKEEKQVTTSEVEADLFNQSNITDEMREYSKINKYFSKAMLKVLMQIALNNELTDNNKKADFIDAMLAHSCRDKFGNPIFRRIGTGTNRTAFQRGYFVFKIALDRRGIIDNRMEYLRSPECPNLLALTYETNGLIAVSEYVNLFTQDEFRLQRDQILYLLSRLASNFIFGDMGYSPKNYCNFGWRKSIVDGRVQKNIVILDYAYMHPLWQNERAMICPNCGDQLRYDPHYTGFICANPSCGSKYTYLDVKRRMTNTYENIENMYMTNISLLDMPDMENISMNWTHDLLPDDLTEGQEIPVFMD